MRSDKINHEKTLLLNGVRPMQVKYPAASEPGIKQKIFSPQVAGYSTR